MTKKITINDIKKDSNISKKIEDGYRFTIKNKTKIDLSILDKKTLKKLYLIDKANNRRFIEDYNNYCNYYNNLSYSDLKDLDLFTSSNASKTRGFWSLSFNSSLNCCNLNCSNFLRCYSKKIEKFRPNVLKMVARQATIFNRLSINDLVLKFKPVLSGYAPVRLCQYGSIKKEQFIKLLTVLDSLKGQYSTNKVYIYLDKPFKVPSRFKYLINLNYIVINASNRLTYDYFKNQGLSCNLIVSKDKKQVEQLKKDGKNFKYCNGNCTVCNYCMHYQKEPILFKNH